MPEPSLFLAVAVSICTNWETPLKDCRCHWFIFYQSLTCHKNHKNHKIEKFVIKTLQVCHKIYSHSSKDHKITSKNQIQLFSSIFKSICRRWTKIWDSYVYWNSFTNFLLILVFETFLDVQNIFDFKWNILFCLDQPRC
jgi:hypothetical protein